jgi:hypothetical protein
LLARPGFNAPQPRAGPACRYRPVLGYRQKPPGKRQNVLEGPGSRFNCAGWLAKAYAREYFQKYPKDRYQTEVERWANIQSSNIEFVMKRLREPK